MYCDQTVGWIKMPLGMEVGLGHGHIVLDGNPAPLRRATTLPLFSAHGYYGHTVGLDHDVTWHGGRVVDAMWNAIPI